MSPSTIRRKVIGRSGFKIRSEIPSPCSRGSIPNERTRLPGIDAELSFVSCPLSVVLCQWSVVSGQLWLCLGNRRDDRGKG